MTYTGKIQTGVAVVTPPVNLPEGTAVTIETRLDDRDFWQTKSVEELAQEQNFVPINNLKRTKN